MTDTSPVLALPYILPSQAQKHVTHNDAIRHLDAIVQLAVISAQMTTPPLNATSGDRYVVADAATGDWEGQDGAIAVADGSGWVFYAPLSGWRADDLSSGSQIRFDGNAWAPVIPNLDNLAHLGIGTIADATNPLSVAGPATLLTHDGADHRLKINKAQSSDTSSLVFQTGWSGRAEMGTTGSDDFAIKVSADGSDFKEALVLDRHTGAVQAPGNPAFLAYSTGAWTTVTTANTDLLFANPVLNRGSYYNPLTGRFTAPVDGLYCFVINGLLGNATNGRVAYAINGVTQTMQMQFLIGAAPLSFTSVFGLTAGQYVTCRTGNLNINFTYFQAHTAFSGWLIS